MKEATKQEWQDMMTQEVWTDQVNLSLMQKHGQTLLWLGLGLLAVGLFFPRLPL